MNILKNRRVPAFFEQAEHPSLNAISNDQVDRLPEPIQRYLRYARVIGKDPIQTVRLKQRGEMRQKPGQRWMPLVAHQSYITHPPTFLWRCTMRPFPLFWISAMDQFVGGHGRMRVKLLSCLPFGDESGWKMDQGELQRYLGEMVWFPTAWLSDAISWQALDEQTAQATLHYQDVCGSVRLHVNEQGQLTHATAKRYMGAQGELTPWSVQAQAYREVNGMCIPTRVEVTWHLASGDFTWFRVTITQIEYNQ